LGSQPGAEVTKVSVKQCFVIAPIGQRGTETRERSDLILEYLIRPVVRECGYEATRADEIAEPGMISTQVIQRVLNDPLVVADLTGHNANVFYELALRHATKKPLIQLIAHGEPLPFDVAGMRTIFVDHRDLRSVDSAKSEMLAQIRASEKPDARIDTPISLSVDLQSLWSSEQPKDRALGNIIFALEDIRSVVTREIYRVERHLTSDLHDTQTYIVNTVLDVNREIIEEVVQRALSINRANASPPTTPGDVDGGT
jgi:hypothetical protein